MSVPTRRGTRRPGVRFRVPQLEAAEVIYAFVYVALTDFEEVETIDSRRKVLSTCGKRLNQDAGREDPHENPGASDGNDLSEKLLRKLDPTRWNFLLFPGTRPAAGFRRDHRDGSLQRGCLRPSASLCGSRADGYQTAERHRWTLRKLARYRSKK